jgi:integrase/recombinase XerD
LKGRANIMIDPSRALVNATLPDHSSDPLVIDTWLRTHRSERTREAYRADIRLLQEFTDHKPLQTVTLVDLLNFQDELVQRREATTTQARRISAIKSLLTFCFKAGYIPVNVGRAIKAPAIEEKLAERIMSEAQVQKMLALETNIRNHAMLRLLYNAGLRVSEVIQLTWNDVQSNQNGGQVRVFGKGSKERYIVISKETYDELQALRKNTFDFSPVFQSHKSTKGGFLERLQVNRIVEQAAIRADIKVYLETDKSGQEVQRSRVSPHWLRHAHGSHAIDHGAPVTLVRDTLGHTSIATTNKYSHARPGESSGRFLPI